MITVQYKPLEALRPIHVSILAVSETTPSLDSIGDMLGVLPMLLEHAADDLVAWKMISVENRQVSLSERAVRCVAVWAATNRRGFWSIENDDRWVLGKGVFFFREPLKSLADAGLDPETGNVLSEAEAIKSLKEYKRAVQRVEKEIQGDVIRARISKTITTNGNLAETIETSLRGAKSWLHLNRLCRQAEVALVEISGSEPHQKGRITEFKRLLQQQKSQAEQSLNRQFRETDVFTKLLLASWLKQRAGFLGEVASTEPNALLIRSEKGDVEWLDQTPKKQRLNHRHQVNHDSQPTTNPSMFDDFFKFVGSFFR
jgi:hypothetical protein